MTSTDRSNGKAVLMGSDAVYLEVTASIGANGPSVKGRCMTVHCKSVGPRRDVQLNALTSPAVLRYTPRMGVWDPAPHKEVTFYGGARKLLASG